MDEKQNDKRILLLLKAQRATYSTAKSLNNVLYIVTVLLPVIFSIMLYFDFFSNGLFDVISIFISMCTLVLLSVIEKYRDYLVDKAVSIQQYIDTKLFDLPNSFSDFSDTAISELGAKYTNDNLDEFKLWYQEYSDVSNYEKVLLAQKENMRWDKKLKTRYMFMQTAIFTALLIILVITGLCFNVSLRYAVTYFSWFIPLLRVLCFYAYSMWIDIKAYLKLESMSRKVEENLCENEDRCALCFLQNRIFELRRGSVMVPDWFYNRFKNKDENYENNIAAEYSRSKHQKDDK